MIPLITYSAFISFSFCLPSTLVEVLALREEQQVPRLRLTSSASQGPYFPSHPLTEAHIPKRNAEEDQRQQDEDQVKHLICSSHRYQWSNVNITPKIKRCCIGVNPITPGRTSAPLKKPPSGPRESSHRCSSRRMVLVSLYGIRYSSVVVTALTVCLAKVQRPSRSQKTSGRTVALHRLFSVQCTGNWPAIIKARGVLGASTRSDDVMYSNAKVTRSPLRSTMLSER